MWKVLVLLLLVVGCDRGLTKPIKIECHSYDDAALDIVRDAVSNCLPPNSTDIYVDYNPGCLLGGACTFIRCRIMEKDLRTFIKRRRLDFRFDSTQANANNEKQDGLVETWPNETGDGFWGFKPTNVDEYWSYNFIYTNNGGYRMFYDVKRQLFYAEWSSN